MGVLRDLLTRPPDLRDLPLHDDSLDFSLNRLVPGVDNIHYDVHISPRFRRSARRAAFCLLVHQTGVRPLLDSEKPDKWRPIRTEFQNRCRQVMTAAVHGAKSKREVQIDYLCQVAVAKLLKTAAETQYERTLEALDRQLRSYELSHRQNLAACVAIKEKLSWIRQHRSDLMQNCTAVLFGLAAEASGEVAALREANFGKNALLPKDFFSNPMLHALSPEDDRFLLGTYALVSHRSEDPDSHQRLMTLLDDFFRKTAQSRAEPEKGDEPEGGTDIDPNLEPAAGLSGIWMAPENVEILFDAAQTESMMENLPPGKEGREQRRRLAKRRSAQRAMFRGMYRAFRRAGLLTRIAAEYEVEGLMAEYCPPLSPRQVLHFLVEPPSRKRIAARLNRLKRFYGRPLTVSSLNKAVRRVRGLPGAKRRERVRRFLKAIARYHRDLIHYRLIKSAMDATSLEQDERTLRLSSENQTLYTFLLPDEQDKQEQPIISHAILKADVRGSTDLTYRMRSQQLNPASFFSFNLFDPITEVLFDYDATKEFIEGDALILSIYEQKDTPEGWYSVGRACGMAIRILQIVSQSNIKSRKHRLPTLELGIGICYNETAPAFLFDGANRIMISPAINRADRLSGCDKSLRKLIEKQKLPFRLYVFQTVSESEKARTADDLFLRYNVNGIELNPGGFRKLSKEINLVPLHLSGSATAPNAPHRFFAGKIPLTSGRYQPLVVREATVFRVAPGTLRVIGKTPHHYYEVCTQRRLYEKAEQVLRTGKN